MDSSERVDFERAVATEAADEPDDDFEQKADGGRQRASGPVRMSDVEKVSFCFFLKNFASATACYF